MRDKGHPPTRVESLNPSALSLAHAAPIASFHLNGNSGRGPLERLTEARGASQGDGENQIIRDPRLCAYRGQDGGLLAVPLATHWDVSESQAAAREPPCEVRAFLVFGWGSRGGAHLKESKSGRTYFRDQERRR